MKKGKTQTMVLCFLVFLMSVQLNALPINDTFISPANTTSGELKLKNNSELNGTDASGNVYTANLSENNGKCYDTDGNEVTCQAKGEDIQALYFQVDRGDGSDGDIEIDSTITIDSLNIDDYDNAHKFKVKKNANLTVDDVTIHIQDDLTFDKDAKHDLTIKGNVVIYANHFDLNNKAGINIDEDASLKIFTKKNIDLGEKSFVNTHGHPEHFLAFAKNDLNIKDNKDNKQGDFNGFFYAVHDLHVGKESVVNGAVAGGHMTEIKDDSKINFDSSAIENTDVAELIENTCSALFGGPVSTIDGGELKIENNVKLKNTPSDGSLYTDNINQNDGKCYDADGNEVTCKESGITALTQNFSVDKGDGSDGDKEVSSDLTIDSSNISSYDNMKKFKVKKNIAFTLDSVVLHAKDDFIFEDNADDVTIKGNVIIYAKKFELGKNVGIKIENGASLKIFVSDSAKFIKNSSVDTNEHPESFVLFSNDKIEFKDQGNGSYEGFFYANGDLKVGKNTTIKGAVTGKKVNIVKNTVIEYDSNAASLITNTGVCVDGNGTSENKNYKFDAWDTFRYISDRNISTKIVNQEFNLTIASLDENGSDYQEFNGTVCASVDNNTSKLDFRDDNTTTASFKVSRAIKEIRVHIVWKKNIDESCPLSSEDNETNSSDNFAIRPEKFTISSVGTLRAGNVFDFNVSANAPDYNTTGVAIEANLTKDCSIKDADFNITTIDFLDGESNNTVKFGDVGVVDINITDKNWASVDGDDTPQNCDANGTYICLDKTNITIIPDHFEINSTMSNVYDTNFTYFSNDLNMSARLDINITAQNKQNQTTQNYNSACYAKDIDINISTNTRADLPIMLYIYKDASDINSTSQSGNIDIVYKDGNFTTDSNGSSKIRLYINYDRNKSVKLNPFDLDIVDINVTDENATFGTTATDENATFYYGRVKTKDISTNKQTISNSLHVEVYSNGKINDFHQESLNWYIMKDDNQQAITDLNDSSKFSDIIDTALDISNLVYDNGTLSFDLINTDYPNALKAYIHIKIPSYLWYSHYEDYNATGDCSKHPCFLYVFNKIGVQNGVQSGDFNGSNIGYDYNATKTKKGIKVFR